MIIRLAAYTLCVAFAVCVLLPSSSSFNSLTYGQVVRSAVAGTKTAVVQQPVSIQVTGDVFLGRAVERLMRQQGDGYPYRRLPEDFFDGDLVLVNFESAVPDTHQPTPDFGWRFSVATEFLPALRDAGVTHASLANNHSFDFGKTGYEESVRNLQTTNLRPVGAQASSTIQYHTVGNETIAIVALSTVGGSIEPQSVVEIFANLATSTTYTMAYVHWGTEYELVHNTAQVTLAELLIEQGADVVIGHHPHVVQDISWYNGVPIFYSLGNFIFDQYFDESVQEGLVLDINLTATSTTYALQPVTSTDSRSQPRPLTPTEKKQFLQAVADRSADKLVDDIRAGIIVQPR